MSVLQRVVGLVGTLQLAVLLAVLIGRRHYRLAPIFTLYAGGLCATHVALGLFYVKETWIVHQAASAALRFGVALELAQRIFGAFPAAAATARRVMLALIVVTGVLAMSAGSPDYDQFSTLTVPSLATGTVWILTALAALVLWYRLPLTVMQKAILIGFAPYLLVFTVMMNLLASLGWEYRAWLSYVNTASYMALIGYWTWTAWRNAPEAIASVGAPAMADMARQVP
jgi:hypothetical protein